MMPQRRGRLEHTEYLLIRWNLQRIEATLTLAFEERPPHYLFLDKKWFG
jgi:hypothetical protein